MNLFERLLGRPSSAQMAKQRLQLVLVHDRAEIPPGMLALIKDDIIAAISRHVSIDREHVVVNVTHDDSVSKLLVDIPLLVDADGRTVGRARGEGQRPSRHPTSS